MQIQTDRVGREPVCLEDHWTITISATKKSLRSKKQELKLMLITLTANL